MFLLSGNVPKEGNFGEESIVSKLGVTKMEKRTIMKES